MADNNTSAAFEAYFDNMDSKVEKLQSDITKSLYLSGGSRQFTTFQDGLFGFDSIRNAIYMPEMEGHGFTFITRPKLNLSTPSVRADRVLSLLDTLDPQTVAFAVRASLDTHLTTLYSTDTAKSQYFNKANPFIPILSNRLLSLNNWPDITLDVETSEGGFFSESITYPKGHDQLTRNYDLSASFSDVQGGVVHNLIMMWVRWIHLATRGRVLAYMEDIEARRMSFTSSIYRFVMDPSNRYITKWAKATGCFPRSVPTGAYFNYDSNASNVDTAMNLAVPFTVAGRIEYMDPIILKEFNMLIDKFSSDTKNGTAAHGSTRMLLNFRCIPYIDITGSNELKWLYQPNDTEVKNLLALTNTSKTTTTQTATTTAATTTAV